MHGLTKLAREAGMSKWSWFPVVLGITLLFAGCATYEHGRNFDTAAVKQIKPGMPKAEVHRMLGDPTMRNIIERGKENWVYTFGSSASQMDGKAFIPYYGLFVRPATVEGRTKTLTVSFENDLVASCQYRANTTRMGGGMIFDAKDEGTTGYSAPCDLLDAEGLAKQP
jgi:outer membrane protein assembly factor BamE (lipoprotein component of BamABCDE complex)